MRTNRHGGAALWRRLVDSGNIVCCDWGYRAADRGAEASLGCRFPYDDRAFLASEDGVEATFGDAYVALWPAKQLVERNVGYDVSRDAQGLVLIGSDGAGEGIAFDYRQRPPGIVLVPFTSLGGEDALPQASSFTEFMAQRVRGEGFKFRTEAG